MPEDFDNYFTVEFYGSKGWEVCWTSDTMDDAIAECEKVHKDGYQFRLTSPKSA
jgi:hypothetical protein